MQYSPLVKEAGRESDMNSSMEEIEIEYPPILPDLPSNYNSYYTSFKDPTSHSLSPLDVFLPTRMSMIHPHLLNPHLKNIFDILEKEKIPVSVKRNLDIEKMHNCPKCKG